MASLRAVVANLVILGFTCSIFAQRPIILDPKIKNEPDDDLREIKTRDAIAAQAEIDDSLRSPNAKERNAAQIARFQDFVGNVKSFANLAADLSTYRPDPAYSRETVKIVLRKSKNLERLTRRILSFLDAPKMKTLSRTESRASIEERTGQLCWLAVGVMPKLNQLAAAEREGTKNVSLRQSVIEQLQAIVSVSEAIRH